MRLVQHHEEPYAGSHHSGLRWRHGHKKECSNALWPMQHIKGATIDRQLAASNSSRRLKATAYTTIFRVLKLLHNGLTTVHGLIFPFAERRRSNALFLVACVIATALYPRF